MGSCPVASWPKATRQLAWRLVTGHLTSSLSFLFGVTDIAAPHRGTRDNWLNYSWSPFFSACRSFSLSSVHLRLFLSVSILHTFFTHPNVALTLPWLCHSVYCSLELNSTAQANLQLNIGIGRPSSHLQIALFIISLLLAFANFAQLPVRERPADYSNATSTLFPFNGDNYYLATELPSLISCTVLST